MKVKGSASARRAAVNVPKSVGGCRPMRSFAAVLVADEGWVAGSSLLPLH